MNSSLYGVREYMDSLVKRLIYDNTMNNLLFQFHTGLGKSTTITAAADKYGARWVYVAPRHDVIDSILTHSSVRKFDFVHLKGRAKECHSSAYRKLAEQQVDISPFCEICEYRRDGLCEYYNNKEKLAEFPHNIACVHSHFNTSIFSDYIPKFYGIYDLIIIDEIPMGEVLRSISISEKDVTNLLITTRILPMKSKYLVMLEDVYKAFYSTLKYNRFGLGNLKNYSGESFTDLYSAYSRSLVSHVGDNNGLAGMTPPAFLQPLLKMLANTHKDNWERSMTINTYGRKYVSVNHYSGPIIEDGNIKIIGMDGTASKESWDFVLGRKCDIVYKDYPLENVYMLENRPQSQGYIVGERGEASYGGKESLRLLEAIIDYEGRNVIVCCSKKVKRFIEANISPAKSSRVKYAIYYALRSSNEFYQKSDVIVLFHKPSPPPQQVECYATITGKPNAFWRKYFTVDEMMQAIGRIRQAIDDVDGKLRSDIHIYSLPDMTSGLFADNLSQMVKESRLKLFTVSEMEQYLSGKPYIYEALPGSIPDIATATGVTQVRVGELLARYACAGVVKNNGSKWTRVEGSI